MVLARASLHPPYQSIASAKKHTTLPPNIGQAQGMFSPTWDVLDYTLFLPCIWLLCALSIYVRLGGAAIVLGLVGILLAYAILRQTAPPKLLSAFMLTCIITAIASHYRLFPTSWQVVFRDAAIPRQLAPVVTFFVMAWASKAYFKRRFLAGDPFVGGAPIMFLSFAVAPIVLLQQGFQYEGEDTASSTIAMFGSFTNNIIIALFYLTASAFCSRSWYRYAAAIVLVAIAIASEFAQFRVMIAGAIIILLGVPGRLATAALLLALLIGYAIGMFFIPEILSISPNSGIRLAFIADAFKSFVDTHGLGIGYGTESVRFYYNFPGRPRWQFLPDPSTITPDRLLEALSTGVHNSFIQALLRTGLLGIVLLVASFLAAFPKRDLPRGLRSQAAVLFSIIVIACFVNPALESPVQGMGVGFVYGYLIVLRSYAPSRLRSNHPATL